MGKNYKSWKPSNIYRSARIGNGTNIGAFTEIGKDVKIGENCKIGSGAFIPEGVTIEDNVFIGPHVCFSNDLHPQATGEWCLTPTLVKKNAVLGLNATILPGVIIGEGARVGAGSVVVCNIPDGETWVGNPARRINKIEQP
jgi:UDP-2-acetamido-3-amino-2,3-dideoxy-glucuronate N-acetyltransferase